MLLPPSLARFGRSFAALAGIAVIMGGILAVHQPAVPVAEAATVPGFQLTGPANRTLSLNRGTSVTTTIRLKRLSGYTGRPPLRVEGLPAGITATFATSLIGSASTLRIRTTAQSPLGSFPFQVVSSEGDIRSSLHFTLNVQSPTAQTFSLWANASRFSVRQGNGVFIPLGINRWKTKEDVTIRILQAPAGLSASPLIIAKGTSRGTLLLQASDALAVGSYKILVDADSANARRTLALTVNVTKKPVAAPTPVPTPPPIPTPLPTPLPLPTPPTVPLPPSTPTTGGTAFDIGSPTLRDIWVDPVRGNDANDGNTRNTAVKHVYEAWRRIPNGTLTGTGYRVQLVAGTYPKDHLPNYWESKQGTAAFPIVFQAADGRGSATFEGDINMYGVEHFYALDFNIIPQPAGDAFHCEKCDTTLLRGMKLSGGNRSAHETVKVNQSQRFYIEDSEISGADDNAIDFVAVQYGHVLRSKISNAQDWCAYVKGGSAYIHWEGNEIFNCGTGGFVAGQGAGLEFMESPWLHYEAYGITFVNNVIRDTGTAGMGVNGGYNILFAHNTLVRAGTRDHFFEANHGGRECDGNRTACATRMEAGAWGSLSPDVVAPIPNRNVYVYNNLFYGARGQEIPYLFQIGRARTAPAGTGLNGLQHTDTNLQIKGNVIWNGNATDLGIYREEGGCADTNPTCNVAQLERDNAINGTEPRFTNLAGNDFHPTGDALAQAQTFAWPDFTWSDLPTRPLAPNGLTKLEIMTNKDGAARTTVRAGAY